MRQSSNQWKCPKCGKRARWLGGVGWIHDLGPVRMSEWSELSQPDMLCAGVVKPVRVAAGVGRATSTRGTRARVMGCFPKESETR